MRLTAEHRREQIVQAARALSYEGGLYDWSLDIVAEHVGISRPGVRYYFGSTQSLRAEIIVTAVRDRDVPIVVQAMAKFDPLVSDVPRSLRRQCGAYLSGVPA